MKRMKLNFNIKLEIFEEEIGPKRT
jgi:hypothetical protein